MAAPRFPLRFILATVFPSLAVKSLANRGANQRGNVRSSSTYDGVFCWHVLLKLLHARHFPVGVKDQGQHPVLNEGQLEHVLLWNNGRFVGIGL